MFPVTYIAGETVILQGGVLVHVHLLMFIFMWLCSLVEVYLTDSCRDKSTTKDICMSSLSGDEGDNFYVIDQGEMDVRDRKSVV